MENIEQLINNYIVYYKKTYPDTNIKNMFDNINYDDLSSTNHIMEMFYMDLLKHRKTNNIVYEDVSEINFDKVDEIYGLKVNENIKYISESIISLLYIIENNNYKDWYIINLK